MKFKPESDRGVNTKDMDDLPAGNWNVQINSYNPEVKTERWSGAIVEFVGVGEVARISEFIDEKTAWKFKRLAKALGDDGMESYRAKDEEGYSLFDPGAFVGKSVCVEVGEFVNNRGETKSRINKIHPMGMEGFTDPSPDSLGLAEVGDPQNLDDGRHDSGANDNSDIPF